MIKVKNIMNNDEQDIYEELMYRIILRSIMIHNMFDEEEEDTDYNRIINESFNESLINSSLQKTDNIINISSKKYALIENKEKYDKNCCICFEEFVDDCDISVLKCDHLLHMICMIEWGKYKTSCPVCRENV